MLRNMFFYIFMPYFDDFLLHNVLAVFSKSQIKILFANRKAQKQQLIDQNPFAELIGTPYE